MRHRLLSRLCLFSRGAQAPPLQGIPGEQDFLQFARELLVLHCAARLLRQWFQTWRDLAHNIAQAFQVLLSLAQAIFGVGSLHLVGSNACRVLKQAASFFGAQTEGGIDQTLPNDCIRVVTNARLRQ